MSSASAIRDRDGQVIRRARRHKMFQPAELSGAVGVRRGHLLDLSISGGQVHLVQPPAAGTIVTLTCGELSRPARVAWVDGRRVGLAFVLPLTQAEFSTALDRGAPTPGVRRAGERTG